MNPKFKIVMENDSVYQEGQADRSGVGKENGKLKDYEIEEGWVVLAYSNNVVIKIPKGNIRYIAQG